PERKLEHVAGVRSGRARAQIKEVGDDEDGEQRAFGHDEAHHPDLPAVGQYPVAALAAVVRRRHSYFQSGSSGCFRSHSGRLLRTSGSVAKLYSGGGDVVAHSSVQASHGSLPATWPWRSERTTFQMKSAIAADWNTTPTDATRFTLSQPRPAA